MSRPALLVDVRNTPLARFGPYCRVDASSEAARPFPAAAAVLALRDTRRAHPDLAQAPARFLRLTHGRRGLRQLRPVEGGIRVPLRRNEAMGASRARTTSAGAACPKGRAAPPLPHVFRSGVVARQSRK